MKNVRTKNLCPNCGAVMLVKEHEELTTKLLAQAYYFTEWYVCPECRYIKHFEKNKLYGNIQSTTTN